MLQISKQVKKRKTKNSILNKETLHANIGLTEFQNKAKTTIIYA